MRPMRETRQTTTEQPGLPYIFGVTAESLCDFRQVDSIGVTSEYGQNSTLT